MTVRIRTAVPGANAWVRGVRYILLIAGLLTLAYVAYAYSDAAIFQAYQNWRFQESLSDPVPGPPVPAGMPAKTDLANAESLRRAARAGSPLGRIEIQSIGLAVMVLEGDDDRTLRRAAGHIPGTSLPGQHGNVAVAGHRDTFFRGLRNIRKNDEIEFATLNGFYRYRVDFTKVVEPDDAEALSDSDDATLTLVTCYPFRFVGPAPKRFIVRAHRSAD